jgi:hypothetical protein
VRIVAVSLLAIAKITALNRLTNSTNQIFENAGKRLDQQKHLSRALSALRQVVLH